MERSEKQKQASRENGNKGGVKTTEGKEATKYNALKHGILAHAVTDYDIIDLDELYQSLTQVFSDDCPYSQFLIQQLALSILRLSRCSRAETEFLLEILDPKQIEVNEPFGDLNILKPTIEVIHEGSPATVSDGAWKRFSMIYDRYEPRFFNRALKLFQALQTFKK